MSKNAAHDFLYVFQSQKPVSSTSASLDGLVADLMGFDEMLVIFNSGTAVGAASHIISVRVSANSDGSSSSALTGAAFAAVTTANDEAVYVGRVDLSHLDPATQRYAFTRSVGDAANANVFSTSFVLLNWKYLPIDATSLSPNGNGTQTASFNVSL